MKTKVAVLLSAYNGELFIEEQMLSIARQRGVEVDCFIRDDGSSDQSVKIIQAFCEKNPNFHLISGKNIGCINSFNELMKTEVIDEHDFIAFCDQDDIWLEDKLISGVTYLQTEGDNLKNTPMVYCSNLLVFDEGSGETYLRRNYVPRANKYTVLVQNYGTGCTMIFNQAARKIYNDGIGSRMEWHDYWMVLVGTYFGKVIYDEKYYIKYRLHGDNQVGAYKKTVKNAINNLKLSTAGHRVEMLNDFLEIYKDNLSNRDKKIISTVSNYKKSIIGRIRLAIDYRYHGYETNVTMNFKLRALLGLVY